MPDAPADKRLDGWKAIAHYFRRDRTTVMRWARDRALPVHRMPGGVQGSVFAFEHELASWALRQVDVEDPSSDMPDAAPPPTDTAAPPPPTDAPPDAEPGSALPTSAAHARIWGARWALFGLVPLIGIGAIALHGREPVAPSVDGVRAPSPLPTDPVAAADYAAARDLWAQRTAESLRQSIALYARVIARDPEFAPAHVGLAEAWLISREYGDATEAQAYGQAQDAVDRALRLDSGLASAHRARGFIQYWWHDRAQEADASFRRALSIDPKDGLTHFWYANMLADRGDHANAARAYDRARVLLPGTPAIEVERACADWQAGRDARAINRLNALKDRYPDDATIRNCLAWAYISGGDIAGYAREFREAARLRGERRMLALADRLDRAVARDPSTAHRILIADARREFAEGARQTRISPAFYASAMGDREAMEQLMREAAILGERWHSMNLVRRMATRWRGDAEVMALLARLDASGSTRASEGVADSVRSD
ncbi:tetratricopeptide repeat protein [Sphingomonas aestuarii]